MTLKSQIIEVKFHNKMVSTKGYRCNLTVHKTKPEDFHHYTVTVQNQYGIRYFIMICGMQVCQHIQTLKLRFTAYNPRKFAIFPVIHAIYRDLRLSYGKQQNVIPLCSVIVVVLVLFLCKWYKPLYLYIFIYHVNIKYLCFEKDYHKLV